MMKRIALILPILIAGLAAPPSEAVELKYSRSQLEAKWAARIGALLKQGKLPLIDMEASLKPEQIAAHIPADLSAFDDYAIAMMSADGYQRPKDGAEGYRWSDDILELVNAHPEHFIPTANGGTNPNWLKQKGGEAKHFIDQMQTQIRSGKYYNMGEFDFRHYMSSSQCRKGNRERDSDIALNGENGHRVFALSEETGVPFVIHLEPEDAALAALEEMLAAYPKAKVIVAHFAQVRHPERAGRFTPDYVRRLLSGFPNLYYDLANGQPNRKYKCAGTGDNETLVGDTVLWAGPPGGQRDTVSSAYKAVLTEFSERFVFATDYGGGRPPLPTHFRIKTENFHRIVGELPEAAKHNIAYRNAWRLLTGRSWSE